MNIDLSHLVMISPSDDVTPYWVAHNDGDISFRAQLTKEDHADLEAMLLLQGWKRINFGASNYRTLYNLHSPMSDSAIGIHMDSGDIQITWTLFPFAYRLLPHSWFIFPPKMRERWVEFHHNMTHPELFDNCSDQNYGAPDSFFNGCEVIPCPPDLRTSS